MSEPLIAVLSSNDPVSRILLNEILKPFPRSRFLVIEDRSLSWKKIGRLLRHGRVRFFWLLEQFLAGKRQRFALAGRPLCQPDVVVSSNQELLTALNQHPDLKFLLAFRAGLLVRESVLQRLPCINTHYARLLDYGGLQSIHRALKNGDYDQEATVHQMVKEIDSGEVLRVEPYRLDPQWPYWKNELHAAEAGVLVAQGYLEEWFAHALV